jgi:3D (Asp-Asp-Asp) domain-containing protein
MMQNRSNPQGPGAHAARSAYAQPLKAALVFTLVIASAASAVWTKRAGVLPALVAMEMRRAVTAEDAASGADVVSEPLEVVHASPTGAAQVPAPTSSVDRLGGSGAERWIGQDGRTYVRPEAGHERYYKGRPLRAVRTVWMTTTAYSPDHRSCGKWADGFTANMSSVWTNGMELVAADTRLFPFGTLMSIPGYADERVVPVLDRGGAIKGMRLDLLYPTHRIARKWGVQRLPVTIWEYADE